MDLYFSHEGDLQLQNGDLLTVTGKEELLQAVARCVKADGGALAPLAGWLLTPRALQVGATLLMEACSKDSRLASAPIEARGIPVNATQALFVIGHADLTTPLFTIPFDFTTGTTLPRDSGTIG